MEEVRSAKISPSTHSWIMKNKQEYTVAQVIDILKDFYLEANLPIIKPKNPGKVLFRCNKCKDILEIPAVWDDSVHPNRDQILSIVGQTIPHNRYLDACNNEKRCDGKLYFYNAITQSSGSSSVDKIRNKVREIALLDNKKIAIAKIKNSKGICNHYVGYYSNPYGKNQVFATINIYDIYRNFEIIGEKNRSEPLTNAINEIFKINISNIDDDKSIKKDLMPVSKIFNDLQILPEGMFKECCLYIPAFRYTQNNSKTKYGEETIHGDGAFVQNVVDLLDGKIDAIEALKRFRT
jgi:hypothetical protein